MTDRRWHDVVRALVGLGCRAYHNTPTHVYLCRGATVVQSLPKANPVPAAIIMHLLRAFSFSEQQYLDALELYVSTPSDNDE